MAGRCVSCSVRRLRGAVPRRAQASFSPFERFTPPIEDARTKAVEGRPAASSRLCGQRLGACRVATLGQCDGGRVARQKRVGILGNERH
jgi:hypothetical protein